MNDHPAMALRPVPIAEPQAALDLPWEPRQAPPPLQPFWEAARLGGQVPGAGGCDVVPIDRRARREVESWACRFAQAAVEIVGGDRPATQLVRWTSKEVYDDLVRRTELVGRAGRHRPGTARVQPVRPKVAGVRASFLRADVVEAAVHLRFGDRSRALAARFERVREQWLCTALEFA